MANERRHLLSKKRMSRADGRETDQNYRKTNAMLRHCPVPRLSRAARLAKIEASRSLLSPACAAYAQLGKFPTYVGQVGARARLKARAFYARAKGHCQKAAYHCNKVRKH